MPRRPEFPKGVLGKISEAAARGLAEVVFKDRDGRAAVLCAVREDEGVARKLLTRFMAS